MEARKLVRMAVSNQDVIRAWAEGRSAHSANGALSTDGSELKSYNLVIGSTLEDGPEKTVFNYTAKGGAFVTQTTSTHVALALRVAPLCNPSLQTVDYLGLFLVDVPKAWAEEARKYV